MDDRDQVAAIARLEATVEAMARAVERLEKQADAQTRQLATIERRLSEAQGGLRVMMWLGGAAAGIVAAAAAWAAKHLHWQ